MKKILLTLVILMVAGSAMAEITFVNSATNGELVTVTTATAMTNLNFDAGTAPNTYVVVAIATKLLTDTANPVDGVSFDGSSLSLLGEKFVNDSYEGWAVLYGGTQSGVGDVIVSYTAPTDDSFDSVAYSIGAWSGVGGVGAVGTGDEDSGSPTFLTDSIITSNANSVVVSSVMVGGPETLAQQGAATIVSEAETERIDSAMLSLVTTTNGAYAPGIDIPSTGNRASMISVELLEADAVGATTFITM